MEELTTFSGTQASKEINNEYLINEKDAIFFGVWLYTHMSRILRVGWKRPLQHEDFPPVLPKDHPECCSQHLEKIILPQLPRLKQETQKMNNSEGYFHGETRSNFGLD